MKPVEIVLRRRAGTKEKEEGLKQIKIYCKHLCKCDHVPPIQL
jgi:hypothetical protein